MSSFRETVVSRMGLSNYLSPSSRSSGEENGTQESDFDESQNFLPHLEKDSSRKQHTRSSKLRVTDIFCSIFATLVAVVSLQVLYYTWVDTPHQRFSRAIEKVYGEEERLRNDLDPLYHCGNSSTEALEQGCVFDISVLGWVPTPCYDSMIHQRFLDFGWKFFEDQNATLEVSLERLAESAGTREPFWVQHGFHVTHCELSWQRMHRAIQVGGRLTTHLLNFEHTHHCGMILETRTDLMEINSQILPLLNTC